MITQKEWQKHQKWEQKWHDDCTNSYWEETKQQVYAKKMGLKPEMINGKYPVFDLKGKTIADIGGGAYSLLLKCINFSEPTVVVDPCNYPDWIYERYMNHNIVFVPETGEEFDHEADFDEIWIYNCLQHTINPQKIIKNARKHSLLIRIFEWVDHGVSIGHPHNLKAEKLDKWLGGTGKVEEINENGCHGKCYYGVFKGDFYE